MKTDQEVYDEVKAAVVRVVPEVGREISGDEIEYRPITLADVLRAIHARIAGADDSWYYVDHYGEFGRMDKGGSKKVWNLAADLEHQSPDVWRFLHSILC